MKTIINTIKFFTAITLGLNVSSSIAQFAPEIELADIRVTGGGFVLEKSVSSFHSVSKAGDVNGDGIDDMIIGYSSATNPNGIWSGVTYVVFGRSNGDSNDIELSQLNGSNGFILNGISESDSSGSSVSTAGDVNGDEIDDLIIGAYGADSIELSSGASYVVFGQAHGFPAVIELSDLNGTNGFKLDGTNHNNLTGISVSTAGDFNGDGFSDVIIGAREAGPNGNRSGTSYVVFGKTSGFSAAIELSKLDGNNGFALNGIAAYDGSGNSVSTAGDVNGDGFDDVIIGASRTTSPDGSFTGSSYVVFGRAMNFPAIFELSTLDGNNGFVLNGMARSDYFGNSVNSAGDVNGDGYDDVIISAPGADINGSSLGASYVILGQANGFLPVVELSELNGSNGFILDGGASSVSSAGDFNNDGFDDVIIGAPEADPNGNKSGSSFVVFGQTGGFPAIIELSALDGSDGFVLNGVAEDDFSGSSVSQAGDVNGDGYDDLIINAASAVYVVFGSFHCQPDESIYHINTTAQFNYAIDCANRNSAADIIKLNTDIRLRTFFRDPKATMPDTKMIDIGKTGTRTIESSIILDGEGHTIARDDLSCELDGLENENEFRLLSLIGSNADLSIKNLKLINGCADGAGDHAGNGGAIYISSPENLTSNGSLRIVNSMITNNHSSAMGGAVYLHSETAIIELIDATTFNDNKAGRGGGVFSNGIINQIQNSSFSNNQAVGFDNNSAQGAALWSRAATDLVNNTFYNNEAIGINSFGGALYAEHDVTSMENNLYFSNLADNGADCAQGSSATVTGNNNLSNQRFNLCPNANIIKPSNSLDVDSLADNGCIMPFSDGDCVLTHAIELNSAAIGASTTNYTEVDQRGFGVTDVRDVGAFEYDGFNFDVIFKDNFE